MHFIQYVHLHYTHQEELKQTSVQEYRTSLYQVLYVLVSFEQE